VSSVSVQSGTSATFGGNNTLGEEQTVTATCTTGKFIGGGVTVTGNKAANGIATVTKSYPSSTTVWTAAAVITVHVANGSPPVVQAYALCAS
jgi:hypothetical protein